ncbi:MAG: hypothetical protein UZ15_CFX003000206 [Chloroflexi bacterium OLB15]|nr:MAG: hypothetical protein UZ15_CFX003000206 [Chloroflexi bacterium OLB15]
MDLGITLIFTIAFTGIFLIIQRTERRRRLLVIIIFLIIAELIRWFVWSRGYHSEAWVALFISLILSFGFWLFIGRYNPPGSSDDIQVIGMDD